MSEDAPNVLLFSIDSCRADRFGVYGYEQDTTPVIDRWAESALVCTNAYSTSAWTAPGLVSILSGLYPPVHGVNNRDRMGSPELLTLPKLFKQREYVVPNLNFFTFAPYYLNLGVGKIQRKYFGDRAEDPFLNWLSAHLEQKQSKPFFLWTHITTVHQPYRTTPERLDQILEGSEPSPGIQAVMRGAIVPYGSVGFTNDDSIALNALYDDEIRRVDRFFGKILQNLERAGVLQNTLIILTADHGEELLDHGFVGHASTSLRARLYEEIIRIPLIISWPGRLEGTRLEGPVSQIDILPTVAELLGWELPHYIQGKSLLPSEKSHLSASRPVFFESVIAGNQTSKENEQQWVRGIRQGRYKYVSTGELYDLELDPGEKTNLIGEDPETARRMADAVDKWLKDSQELGRNVYPPYQAVKTRKSSKCPQIHTPGKGALLDYDLHTGALLFGWTGDMETEYLIEYDIGIGDHHVAGTYEVEGNHQILGPFTRELWGNLRAWNPFRFRVSPKADEMCWSKWREFQF